MSLNIVELHNKNKKPKLRINKTIPQVILPPEKNDMFLKWYDEDLRFQNEIPQTFKKGYLFITNLFPHTDITESKKELFRYVAKKYQTTYRVAENEYMKFIKRLQNITLYFEFEDNILEMDIYCNEEHGSSVTIDLDACNDEPNPSLNQIKEELAKNANDITGSIMNPFNYLCFVMLNSVLWYLATTTQTTKYKRENSERNSIYYEKKEIINPKRNKYITTPIYNMKNIKIKKVDSLIKRRKGWTYSHSFQVHGHYRHYSNGKTIFVKPFIKGKGKEELVQKIIINPKMDKKED